MKKTKTVNQPIKTTDFAGLGLAGNRGIKITVHEQSWERLDEETAQKKLAALAKAGVLFITVERQGMTIQK